MRLQLFVATFLLLTGCAAAPPVLDAGGADVVLLGEQHDAESHPVLQERWVATLAGQGTLAALLLEMAERGQSTRNVPSTATEREVQFALSWSEQAWPWERYGPSIMAAVRAGVPVFGANLPRLQQAGAMGDNSLDQLLPGPALKAQQQAIRLGHCGLLPESQVTPLTRIQIARDRSMANAIEAAVQKGKTVVLLAGAGHVNAELGVPQHLPAAVAARPVTLPGEARNQRDYCAELRKQFPQGMS